MKASEGVKTRCSRRVFFFGSHCRCSVLVWKGRDYTVEPLKVKKGRLQAASVCGEKKLCRGG